MSDTTILKTIFIQASAETVWDFLTDKSKLGEWFYAADANLEVGDDYVLSGQAKDGSVVRKCWGSVVEAEKAKKLVCTFTIDPLGGAMTTVTWRLEHAHGGTKLTLVHEGISEAAGDAALPLLLALDAGWDQHFSRLRSAAVA